MKKSLTLNESILVGSMLFGMFFGAGNLIFPIHMGQLAGTNVWPAIIGFIITAVGIPLLGVACLGACQKNNLFDLSSLIGEKYKYFITVVLYLTIGPLFAIPRCATTSFSVGMEPLVGADNILFARLIFTFIFFALALFFALRPSGIINYVGKYINPIFLIFLIILIIISFVNPIGNIANISPAVEYEKDAFFKGFIEGYATMDAIAALAFGITIIRVVKDLGIKNESDVALNAIKSGALGCALMAIIYILTTLMGTMSRGAYETTSNGATALSQISNHYFGKCGIYFLLATITLACFKTALSLIISCSEMFNQMFPSISLNIWTVIFTLFSFIISNFGLDTIITYTVPVLMFLYPLTISLILLTLFGRYFNYNKKVFVIATAFNIFAAIFDLFASLPNNNIIFTNLSTFASEYGNKFLPFFSYGLGWVVPTIIGVVIGMILKNIVKEH